MDPGPSTAQKTWTLHIGDSFTDVPPSSPFYRFVETILHKNVTGGCTPTTYCPATPPRREQMAVFVLLSKEPPGYVPPACGDAGMFSDVPVLQPLLPVDRGAAARGVVAGCGDGTLLPAAPATREQMAVFLRRRWTARPSPRRLCTAPVFVDVPRQPLLPLDRRARRAP